MANRICDQVTKLETGIIFLIIFQNCNKKSNEIQSYLNSELLIEYSMRVNWGLNSKFLLPECAETKLKVKKSCAGKHREAFVLSTLVHWILIISDKRNYLLKSYVQKVKLP